MVVLKILSIFVMSISGVSLRWWGARCWLLVWFGSESCWSCWAVCHVFFSNATNSETAQHVV